MFSRLLEVARDRAGAAMVEFAIVLPLLAVVLLGILQVGFFFFEIVQVQNAAAIGERQFVASRVMTAWTSGNGPYSSTRNAIQGATNLPSLTFTLSAGGTTCTNDTACSSALLAAYDNLETASVTVSNPCLTLLPVSWINNFCPGGVLQATNTQRVN